MSHVGLLLYVLLPKDLEDPSLVYGALRCLSYYATLVLELHNFPAAAHHSNTLARLPLLQEIGIERIVSRLKSTLKDAQKHVEVEGTLTACFHVVWFLVCCRGTAKYVREQHIFKSVYLACTAYSYDKSDSPVMLRAWCAAHVILRCAYRHI